MQLQQVQNRILTIRGQRVMLDMHLAELYEVETRALKQAVKRNPTRFPADFMFELTKEEWQEVITVCDNLLPPTAKFNPAPPAVFTEQGVAMLSSVLRSPRAIEVNIAIMRAFVALRQYLLDYKDVDERIKALQREMDTQFADVNQALTYLLSPAGQRRAIGFHIKTITDNEGHTEV